MANISRSHVKLFLILAFTAIALLIAKPFIITIIVAAIVAYLLWPLHIRIRNAIGEYASALTLTLLSVVALVLMAYYGINILLEESANFYLFLSKINIEHFGPTAQDFARLATTKIINTISEQIVTVIHLIVASIIFFVSLFYFLKEGEQIYKEIVKVLPFESKQRKKMIKNIIGYLNAFVHIQIVIGIIQGTLAVIGFWFFGLPYPLLAGFAAGILSIIPGIGPYILYIPVGMLAYNTFGFSTALGIIIYGLTLGSIMDYLVRPFFYGKKIQLHPLTTFVGIFGGIELFGFVGIIIGPIILSIAIALFKELKING